LLSGIAEALGAKIYCDHRKRGVLSCDVDDPDLLKMLTNDPLKAAVHVVPLWDINAQKMQEYLAQWKGKFTRLIAFRPTGWT
jgi:DNA cross-link repair 1A protein